MKILCLLVFLSITISGYTQSLPTDHPIKTTICEIKKNPLSFDGKVVEIRGHASHGFEDSMFEDPSCFENHSKGLPGIWMDYGGTASTDTMYCCGIKPSTTKPPVLVEGVSIPLLKDVNFERFDRLLHSKPGKEVSIRAVARGRIFAHEVKIGQYNYVGGYGHMGCCMLFVIEQVLEVDSKKPEPSIFQLAKAAENH